MSDRIATVSLLRDTLAACPPDVRVLIAVQPGYPQAVTIGSLVHTPDPADHDFDAVEPDAAAQPEWQGVVWTAT